MGSFRNTIRISFHFLALSFIQFLELQEPTVLRLAWMAELLFLTSPSDNDTSSTHFQVKDSGSEILKLLLITKNNIGRSFVPRGTPTLGANQKSSQPT